MASGPVNEYLSALAAELRLEHGIRVRTRVGHGRPDDAILIAARAEKVDLIIMTTHGRTGLRRTVTGSIAEAVVRRVDVPVLLLRVSDRQIAARSART